MINTENLFKMIIMCVFGLVGLVVGWAMSAFSIILWVGLFLFLGLIFNEEITVIRFKDRK